MAERQLRYSFRFSDAQPASITTRELIQVLSAFNNISAKAGKTIYGSDLRTAVRITHVKPGSIDIQGFVEVFAALQSAFPALPSLALGMKDVADLIKQWLDILKFLNGSPPSKFKTLKTATL